jgi:FAD binding domain
MNLSGIAKFAKSLTGEVVLPRDGRYAKLRLVRNHAVNKHPAVIVRCAEKRDVQLAIEFARYKELPAAVRSGGHSFAGHGVCEDGIVIDLSTMKRVQIDPAHKKIVIEPGSGAATTYVTEITQVIGARVTSKGLAKTSLKPSSNTLRILRMKQAASRSCIGMDPGAPSRMIMLLGFGAPGSNSGSILIGTRPVIVRNRGRGLSGSLPRLNRSQLVPCM